jgi:hypothetical protein
MFNTIIKFDENTYQFNISGVKVTLDKEQYDKIILLNKNFYLDDTHKYPFYKKSGKKYDLFFILFGVKYDNMYIEAENNNIYDMRKSNLSFQHNYYNKIKDDYNIVEFIKGSVKKTGKNAGEMFNSIWRTNDNIFIMHCNPDTHILLCETSYKKILDFKKKNKKDFTISVNKYGDVVSTAKLTLKNIIFLNTSISGNVIDYKDNDKKNNFISNFKNRYNDKEIDISIFNLKDEDNTGTNNIIENTEKINLRDDFGNYDCDKIEKYIEDKFNVKIEDKIYGLNIKKGKTSGSININSKYVVTDKKDKKYVIIHISNNIFTKISFDKLLLLLDKNFKTLYFNKDTGYICSMYDGKKLYLHQILTGFYGNKNNGKKLSIDHINQDKLDNRDENLRIVSQSIQNCNKKKQARKKTAQKLPDELSDDMIPKYVYYANEIIKKNNGTEYKREFFRIEKHPNLVKKSWSTTKSIKISILEKLKQAKKKLNELDGIEDYNEYKLPKYITMKEKPNDKISLNYDRKINGKRQSMRLTIKNFSNKNLKEEVIKFQEAIKERYF